MPGKWSIVPALCQPGENEKVLKLDTALLGAKQDLEVLDLRLGSVTAAIIT